MGCALWAMLVTYPINDVLKVNVEAFVPHAASTLLVKMMSVVSGSRVTLNSLDAALNVAV